MERLRLQHLAHFLQALLRLLLLVRAIEQLSDMSVLFGGGISQIICGGLLYVLRV